METIQLGKDAKLVGRVWHNPVDGKIYAGKAGERYRGQAVFDVSTIEAQVVLDEVLGLVRPRYNLRRACRVINMPELVLSVDIATKLAGSEKVPPLIEAEINAQSYTRTNFDLWKNVVHIVIEDEARKRAVHDIFRVHTEDAARDLTRMENKQVKEIIETATAVTGESWNAMTTAPNNDYDPFNKIGDVVETILGNGYEPNFMAVSHKAWNAFIRNSYVKGMIEAGIVNVGQQGGAFTLPGWPAIQVIVDYALTNTVAVIGDSTAPAVVLGNGPTESARYRNEPSGYDAFIIRQWLEPKKVVSDAIRKLTGVTT